MKFLIAACLFCFSFVAVGDEVAPSLAGTTSVLVSEKAAPAAETKAAEVKATVVAVEEGCSDCRTRRRAFNRGYVVVKRSVSGNSSTTSREVVDNCCNTVRSRTVTKTKCGCRDCKCDRCDCK